MNIAGNRDNHPGVVLAALNHASAHIMEAQLQGAVRVAATACDAEETERLIQQHRPAAVLFDPMIENIEASMLRVRNASRRPLLVALLSGRAEPKENDREGAVAYADARVLRPGKQMTVESFRLEAARIIAEISKKTETRKEARPHESVSGPPSAARRRAENDEKHARAERRKDRLHAEHTGKIPASGPPETESARPSAKPLAKPLRPVAAVVIASSTGGPDALSLLFRALKNASLRGPIFITQHMPPQFTAMLATRLSKESGLFCREGADKLEPLAGEIYVAPGDFHMRLERAGAGVRIRLDKGEKEHFCRPAADPLLRSAAAVYGPQLLGVVMTGMGSDGALGAAEVKRAGGAVIIQTKESSAVWGMPGATYALGAYDAILPPDEIGAVVALALSGVTASPARRPD